MTSDFLWCHRASMERTVEKHYAVKFCFKLINQTYGDNALSRTRVFECHRMFKEDRELVEAPRRTPDDRSNRSSGGHLTFSCFRE